MSEREVNADFAVVSRQVVTPDGVRPAAVLVQDGRIAAVVNPEAVPADWRVEVATDWVVMPGLVDAHVHINEPGRTEWEGFATATRAAAAGGITTLADMPLNSSPVTTTRAALAAKCDAATGQLWADCGFYAGLVPGNVAELEALLEAGVLGVKAFLVHSGIDEFPNATEADLRAALPILARKDVPLLVHAELAGEAPVADDPRRYAAYLASRPPEWETTAIELLINLNRELGGHIHIVHLSAAAALPALAAARADGLSITVETSPHYLYFAAEAIPDGDTRFKCAPPIRERQNQDRLWDGLRAGQIDFIATDHSPCPPVLKRLEDGDFGRAWGGIASLQFLLPVTWTAARRHGFQIADIAEWLSRRPATLLGLSGRKGAIAPGYDADLVLWDPDATFRVTPEMIHHRHRVTPYEGEMLRGNVIKTFVRGRLAYEMGHHITQPIGQIILKE